MENTNWLKQTPDKALYEDLLWSRPENRQYAGKLLIIGGNLHSFAAPAAAFSSATKAGVGSARVLLPDSTKKILGRHFAEAEFLPSTPSGSFAKQSLAEMLEAAAWADGVLLAGDFGRNSETAILLEAFLSKYTGPATIAQDSLDYFLNNNSLLLSRPDTLTAVNMGKLQKLVKNNRPDLVIKHSMSLHELVLALSELTSENPSHLLTYHAGSTLAASSGFVSTTPASETNWQIELAAYAGVWRLQQPSKLFEAMTTAVWEYIQ